ncbi:MAG: IS5 family transposase [Saprospiraceae bacterium]
MAKVISKGAKNQETAEKKKYRVKNWSSYNQALVGRGNITLWFDESLAQVWHHDGPDQQGAQFVYSDECILALLELKAVFRLGYRQLQGFTNSLLRLLRLDLSAPSYSQICRRAQQLDVDIKAAKSTGPMYIVFDSTGLKVFGEGEWKVRKHGYNKRRTWRKLHLGVDESTGFIHAQVLTKNGEGDGDSQQFADLLEQVQSPVDRVSGDGAYDCVFRSV